FLSKWCSCPTGRRSFATAAPRSSARSGEASEESLDGPPPSLGRIEVDVVACARNRSKLRGRNSGHHRGGFRGRELALLAADKERRYLERPPLVPVVPCQRLGDRRHQHVGVERRLQAARRGHQVSGSRACPQVSPPKNVTAASWEGNGSGHEPK